MGKSLIQQRRGMGHVQFRAPKVGKIARVAYPPLKVEKVVGVVSRILHERGRIAPLAQVKVGDVYYYLPAVRGLESGASVEFGDDAPAKIGNVLMLKNIPEGSTISNIERRPGDGGKLTRSAGAGAILFSQTGEDSIVKFPSGKTVLLSGRCRATIGAVAGAGFADKPFLKAGAKYHKMKAKIKLYPRMRGIAMAAVHHPFGGGRHQHPGKSTSTSRNAPSGRKVGHVAPRKTGRKRIRRTLEVR
ncbi:MAG: 50S ribosomal protein L2 [Nitrososphaeria archaeon]